MRSSFTLQRSKSSYTTAGPSFPSTSNTTAFVLHPPPPPRTPKARTRWMSILLRPHPAPAKTQESTRGRSSYTSTMCVLRRTTSCSRTCTSRVHRPDAPGERQRSTRRQRISGREARSLCRVLQSHHGRGSNGRRRSLTVRFSSYRPYT